MVSEHRQPHSNVQELLSSSPKIAVLFLKRMIRSHFQRTVQFVINVQVKYYLEDIFSLEAISISVSLRVLNVIHTSRGRINDKSKPVSFLKVILAQMVQLQLFSPGL